MKFSKDRVPGHCKEMTFTNSKHVRCYIAGICDHYVSEIKSSSYRYQKEWRIFMAICSSSKYIKKWHPRNISMSMMGSSPYFQEHRHGTLLSKLLDCHILPSVLRNVKIQETAQEQYTQTRRKTGDMRLFYTTDLTKYGETPTPEQVRGRFHVTLSNSVLDPTRFNKKTKAKPSKCFTVKRTLLDHFKLI